MQDTGTMTCPFCGGENKAGAMLCENCGQRLRSIRLAISKVQPNADLYEVIPDGEQFVIALRGEVKVQGLGFEDLAQAQRTVAILNSFIEDDG